LRTGVEKIVDLVKIANQVYQAVLKAKAALESTSPAAINVKRAKRFSKINISVP